MHSVGVEGWCGMRRRRRGMKIMLCMAKKTAAIGQTEHWRKRGRVASAVQDGRDGAGRGW